MQLFTIFSGKYAVVGALSLILVSDVDKIVKFEAVQTHGHAFVGIYCSNMHAYTRPIKEKYIVNADTVRFIFLFSCMHIDN